MKKNIIIISLLFILSMLCGIGAGILYIRNENSNIQLTEAAMPPTANPKIELEEFQTKETPQTDIEAIQPDEEVYQSEQYVVTLSDTKILIYKISSDGSMQTVAEKPIDTGSIPREDYSKLYSGIVVDSLESAKELLEDYIS